MSSGCTYREKLITSGKAALSNGDLEKAKVIFDDYLSFSPHKSEGYLYLGFIALYQDRIEDAIEHFENSLKHNDEPGLEYLGLGQAYLSLLEYDIAKEYLEKAREVDEYPVTEYLLGFIYFNEGKHFKAQQALNVASKTYPKRGEIWAALGKILLENAKTFDAAKAYQMAYVYGIREFDLYFGLAEAYYQMGNYHQAIAVAEQALTERHISIEEKEQLYLKLAQYNMNQNPAKSIESFKAILANDPDQAEVLLMLGQLYFHEGMYYEVIDTYEQFLKTYSPKVNVLHTMYRSYLALENYKLAEEYLKALIQLKSNEISYYMELINLYQMQERFKEVIPVYKEALQLTPDDLTLLVNLSGLFLNLEQYEDALPYFVRAIKLNPTNFDLYLSKAYAYYKLQKTKDEKITYEQILVIDPNHLVTINNLAQLLRDTNRLDEAFELYQKAMVLDPSVGKYDKNLGYILLIKEDYVGAREWLKKAIDKDSKDYESYRFLGDTYMGQDQYAEAVKCYEESLKIKPDYYYAIYPLGKAHYFLNELDKAKSYFETYLERYPLNEGSKFYLTRIAWLKDQKAPDFEIKPAGE